MHDEDMVEEDTVFRVGRVVSVDGRQIRVSVDKLKNSSHLLYRGGIVRNVAVASYIKIVKGFGALVAKVDGEHIQEDRSASTSYRRGADPLSRQLEVSLIGYLENGRFERGVREMPLLDNECFILTQEEFELIHTFVAHDDEPLVIGSLAMEPTQPIEVGVDAIFASHVGIFGNTGSGKSYTLAKLYHELFAKFGQQDSFKERAQFVLIDFNGEYVDRVAEDGDDYATSIIAPKDCKKEYVLTTRSDSGPKLPLPATVVKDTTFWTVLLDATEKTQAPFLDRVLRSTYWESRLAQSSDLLAAVADMAFRATRSSDSALDRQTVANLLDEIRTCLGQSAPRSLDALVTEFRQRLHYHGQNKCFYWEEPNGAKTYADNDGWESLIKSKITNLRDIDFSAVETGIDLIRFKIVLQYYHEVISGYSNREHIAPLIKRAGTRVPDIKKLVEASDEGFSKPLIVVSLRDVNLEMRKVIPMLLCKHLYDRKKAEDDGNERYLNLVIDEAHNILSMESTRESEVWRDYRLETFEEIIKEGRKFGVFVTLASQRPHDISPTIISQLHNYFLHRLVNNLDIRAIEKAVAYLDRVSFEALPILPTGTCVLAGVSAQIPVLTKISQLPIEAAPNSRTMSVARRWLLPNASDDEDVDVDAGEDADSDSDDLF